MINLMPPETKEQIRYAKLNRTMVHYVQITVAVVVVLAGVFAWSIGETSRQAAAAATDITDKQASIDKLNKKFAPVAQDVSERLDAIKFVQTSQTHFSAVVADLAKVVPGGVSLDSMTFTGEDAVPVRIAFTSNTYQLALAFRNALTTSPRVAAADIETIALNSDGDFTGSIVIGFNPGKGK